MSQLDNALDLLSGLVLEDGRLWGDAATEEQLVDARTVLDPDGPPYGFLTRSRGFSKTTDLSGLAITAMLRMLPAGSRLYGLASDKDQGRLLVDSVAGFVARTPALSHQITVSAYTVRDANSPRCAHRDCACRAYFECKVAEGKTKKEATRSLKRQIGIAPL